MKLLKFLLKYRELVSHLIRFVGKYDVIKWAPDDRIVVHYKCSGRSRIEKIVYFQRKDDPEQRGFIKFGSVSNDSPTTSLPCLVDQRGKKIKQSHYM